MKGGIKESGKVAGAAISKRANGRGLRGAKKSGVGVALPVRAWLWVSEEVERRERAFDSVKKSAPGFGGRDFTVFWKGWVLGVEGEIMLVIGILEACEMSLYKFLVSYEILEGSDKN